MASTLFTGIPTRDVPASAGIARLYSITASVTLTGEQHEGRTGVFDIASGATVTLPAALGNGSRFEFYTKTTITSNNAVIQVANATDILSGIAYMAQDAADTNLGFETGASDDTITMNGSTKGGIKGDRIVITDVASGIWAITAFLSGTGTEATPFSAAVS